MFLANGTKCKDQRSRTTRRLIMMIIIKINVRMSWNRNPVDLLHNKLRVFPAAKMYSFYLLFPPLIIFLPSVSYPPHICIRYAIQLFIPFFSFSFNFFSRLFTLVLINEKAPFKIFYYYYFKFLATITNKLTHENNKI